VWRETPAKLLSSLFCSAEGGTKRIVVVGLVSGDGFAKLASQKWSARLLKKSQLEKITNILDLAILAPCCHWIGRSIWNLTGQCFLIFRPQ
jgi:hypothetical protein